ncbi:MAG: pilus assembly PilX N-terminal domain-containing protein [Patescibacteria group bacterium]
MNNCFRVFVFSCFREQGQVMLLTVLIISGTILGTTTLAGLLMLNQIRQATNVMYSTQAIFAAEAGMEWQFYNLLKDSTYPEPELENADFVTKQVFGDEFLEFHSVGCAGFDRRSLGEGGSSPSTCPRPINRSLQVFLELRT